MLALPCPPAIARTGSTPTAQPMEAHRLGADSAKQQAMPGHAAQARASAASAGTVRGGPHASGSEPAPPDHLPDAGSFSIAPGAHAVGLAPPSALPAEQPGAAAIAPVAPEEAGASSSSHGADDSAGELMLWSAPSHDRPDAMSCTAAAPEHRASTSASSAVASAEIAGSPAPGAPPADQTAGANAAEEAPHAARRALMRPLSRMPSAKHRLVQGPSALLLSRAAAPPPPVRLMQPGRLPQPPLCLRHRNEPLTAPPLGTHVCLCRRSDRVV